MSTLERALAAKQRLAAALHAEIRAESVRSITGLAVGLDGDRHCVVVYRDPGAPVHPMPAHPGILVFHQPLAPLRSLAATDPATERQHARPAAPGHSIGHYRITAGTHGGLVVLKDGRLCVLSNNHVQAAENSGKAGDPIYQPGPIDGGTAADRFADLAAFVPIDFAGTNRVDCALGWTTFAMASPTPPDGPIDPEPMAPYLGQRVIKHGRTTGLTTGTVVGLHADVSVAYGPGTAAFADQVQVRSDSGQFSAGGDSGSLILDAQTRRPVALLFAGGGADTFANPIAAVMAALGIDRFLS